MKCCPAWSRVRHRGDLMKALILCAGRGERLRPLTDRIPKPLVPVGGRCLLEHHILALRAAGLTQLVVNVSHLGDQIERFVGDGSRWDVQIRVSREGEIPLETGGGMLHALPLLGPEPFLVVNGDVYCDYPFAALVGRGLPHRLHLVLVPNPPHNPNGDFGLDNGLLTNTPRFTYSGIGVYPPGLLRGQDPGQFSVVPLIRQWAERGAASAELFRGQWHDVGTPGRLDQLRELLGGSD